MPLFPLSEVDNCLQNFCASGADKACKTQNFSLVQGKVYISKTVLFIRQILDLQHDIVLRAIDIRRFGRIDVFDIAAGHVAGLSAKELAKNFFKGVKTIAPALPLILFILAITFILQEGMIVDTILYKIYGLISGVSPYKAILMLFAFVALLEFFIGSGTAKAFLIMPIDIIA